MWRLQNATERHSANQAQLDEGTSNEPSFTDITLDVRPSGFGHSGFGPSSFEASGFRDSRLGSAVDSRLGSA